MPPLAASRQGPAEEVDGDVRRLWSAYTVSELGSAIGAGALPLIAVLVLHVSTFEVSLLATVSALASAAVALPLGGFVEGRRKRPVMVTADLIRFLALASVPFAGALGLLTYLQLCVVGVVQTAGTIVFKAASGAHLKTLVGRDKVGPVNSRFETTFWIVLSIGPPLGGALIGWVGATVTVAIDAASFLLSALGIRRLRSVEAPPPAAPLQRRMRDLTAGWRYILGHRDLAALFWNSLVFGGCIMLTSPLLAVMMLRDLGYSAWQYGLVLGVPCVGGVLGALCTTRLTTRFGARTVLLSFGVLRCLWLGLLPLARPGIGGFALILVAETLLLFCAGVFNPSFVTYRMRETPDTHMTRVQTAWSVSTRAAQPAFIAVGGVLAAATSPRTAIAVAAAVLLTSAALLPWRPTNSGAGPVRSPHATHVS